MRYTPPMTPELEAKAKTLLQMGYHQHHIGMLLGGLNQGRISEVKNGHKYASVPPVPPDELGIDLT